MRRLPSILFAAIALGQTGCGTLHNLKAPPPDKAPKLICSPAPSFCFAFGGVTRSALLGGFFTFIPLTGGVQDVGKGGLLKSSGMFLVGAYALVVDTPLSLAGDILTYPIARARASNQPWATWWGEQGAAGLRPDHVEDNHWLTPPAPGPAPPEEAPEHLRPIRIHGDPDNDL